MAAAAARTAGVLAESFASDFAGLALVPVCMALILSATVKRTGAAADAEEEGDVEVGFAAEAGATEAAAASEMRNNCKRARNEYSCLLQTCAAKNQEPDDERVQTTLRTSVKPPSTRDTQGTR